jgi:hypothetical protein
VEERFLLNSANKWVAQAIEDIRRTLPFPLTGGHYGVYQHATFGMVPCQAYKGESEQAVPQER